MDPASELVAKALQPKSGDQVLDMCAAPGGKSLIVAELMSFNSKSEWQFPSGTLIVNEMSEGRRDRLTRVLTEHISKEHRQFIFVKGLFK